MKKEKFLAELRSKLKGLPKDDLESRLSFYEEAINDRMSCGKSEEEAVADLGSVDQIVEEIAEQTPYFTLVKEKSKLHKKLSVATVLLLILGFPLWFPLAITCLVLLLVLYAVIWVLVLVPAIACASSFGYGIIAAVGMFMNMVSGEPWLIYLGASIGSIGVGIMLIPAAIYAVIGFVKLSKLLFIRRKTKLIKREEK